MTLKQAKEFVEENGLENLAAELREDDIDIHSYNELEEHWGDIINPKYKGCLIYRDLTGVVFAISSFEELQDWYQEFFED